MNNVMQPVELSRLAVAKLRMTDDEEQDGGKNSHVHCLKNHGIKGIYLLLS